MHSMSLLGSLTIGLVIAVSCGRCLAAPSGISNSYKCLIGDACNSPNVSSSSIVWNKVFCCLKDHAISISFLEKLVKTFSSYFNSFGSWIKSNNNSATETTDESPNEDSKKDGHVEVNCTCKPVDYNQIANTVNVILEKTFNYLNIWLHRLGNFWW